MGQRVKSESKSVTVSLKSDFVQSLTLNWLGVWLFAGSHGTTHVGHQPDRGKEGSQKSEITFLWK